MAWPFSSNHGHSHSPLCISLVALALVALSLASRSCHCFRTFGFDIHHRFSNPVQGILGIDELPRKGSPEYYVAMAHRDSVFRGRRLTGDRHAALTFAAGHDTYQIGALGFLHYANVSIGTPAISFLVALDTGSDLFWLPCNCTRCVRRLKTSKGKIIDFNIYDPNGSSTSKNVSCTSSLCGHQRHCPSSGSRCPYEVNYLSNGTSSIGFLVEDVLHLVTDDNRKKDADTRITFGCGQIQTGALLDGAAPDGLLGLGMENVSVPSILAKEGLTSNSFSMCFGFEGVGRITFGDNGSLDQRKTPFNLRALHPTYITTIMQIIVGRNVTDLEFHAIFDSGTSFTYLNDPAYTLITKKFNSLIKAKRHSSDSDLPFEYCYDISPNQNVEVPFLNLTMKGGDDYYVMDPIVLVSSEDEGSFFCLGMVKSDNINIIGQNFMTGYRIVFDRENMILGWKESNCTDDVLNNTSPVSPSPSPAVSPPVSPAMAVNPAPTSHQSDNPGPGRLPSSRSFKMKPTFAIIVIMILFPLLATF